MPFQAFIPSKQRAPSNFVNQHTLFEKFKFSKPKIELIRELELLIIDEVSMLRADTLDCIDFTLRTIRKNQLDAFGGVQVLFIGDLFQL
ncbi:MAG TPA: AAA family ATPase, partial [Chitinophagales bacterium]|nr:AAA family ATPase [Chitinophagales bacterium]